MSLDGKVLRSAIEILQERKSQRESEIENRRVKIYSEFPRIRQIDQELKETMLDTIARVLKKGGDPQAEIQLIQDKNLTLQDERAKTLKGAGYPEDYIDDKPICDKCGDSGFYMGKRCSCLMDIYKKLQNEELSSFIKLGEENFESFSLDYYDNSIRLPATGETARETMERNFGICHNYAHGFNKDSKNLLLIGGTGLGKTFLSTCIAKVVSEKAYSVVYDTSVNIFTIFEEEKFNKSNGGNGWHDTQRYFKSDLLIMDDLGTEMTTAFVASALYNLINTRLINNKKTIINSNLSIDELGKRYSDQIMSRLKGEYITLSFYGQDIRLLKNRF